jgi:ABC-type branched-subunit amino acid transport system ATPase component/MFS family permease
VTDVLPAEAAATAMSAERAALRERARRVLGVTGATGAGEDLRPLRQLLREDGLSVYPLVAVGLLGITDLFQGYGFSVMTPEISRALGVGKGAIAGAIALKTIALALAPLPVAALASKRRRRALLCILTGIAWAVIAAATGYVVLIWGLLAVLVLDGLTSGTVLALHQPLLLDSYPAQARVRVMAGYGGFVAAGNILSPLLVAALATAGLTWRGVFVALGGVALLFALAASRLEDPGFGRFDVQQVKASIRAAHREPAGADDAAPEDEADEDRDGELHLGFFETVQRLLLIPTVRRLLASYAVIGMMLVPYQTFLFFFLAERWRWGPGQRGVFFAFTAACAMVALALFARAGEERFRRDPGGVVRICGVLLVVGLSCICLGVASPWVGGMIAGFATAAAVLAILPAAIASTLLSIVPPRMRSHAAALQGIFLGGVGGVIGALFLTGVDRRFGVGGAIVSLAVPGVIGAALLASAGALVGPDLDRMIDEIVEGEEVRAVRRSGGRLPMLACRGIDFSYGQIQVLFGVDLTVDEGEMVALLGVNGAGKSTLLKAISGIGLPTAGSIRLEGHDITHVSAERRLRLGITQVPGGRAVFGSMSVIDNLRAFGHSLDRGGPVLDDAIDRSFAAFPRLHELRAQPAATLSGGEQQMLALSKALMLRPRLLLIDELSLGLAPVIVGQLLDMVREINREGTAVVLVEQSVNIALNLVEHAYFMERGQVRFDGSARELLGRDDLLRAVFLEGADRS